MKIQVSIADDHPIVLMGLERMITEHPLVELCSISKNGDALLNSLQLKQPDVLLLDIQMPGKQGDELAKIIVEKYPTVAILVLTNLNQPFHIRTMFQNGVKGYLLKSADQYTLIQAIDTVHKGNQFIDPTLKGKMPLAVLGNKGITPTATITKREQEILNLICEGLTSAQIAKKIFITLSTVENHRLNLFLKLGVKNVAGLIKKATELGLIK